MPSLFHVGVEVRDLEAMADFFAEFLRARKGERYENRRSGLRTIFLDFDGGTRIELLCRPEASFDPSSFHLSFLVQGREEVDSLAERARRRGLPVVSGPRVTGDGYYEVLFRSPEGHSIEATSGKA